MTTISAVLFSVLLASVAEGAAFRRGPMGYPLKCEVPKGLGLPNPTITFGTCIIYSCPSEMQLIGFQVSVCKVLGLMSSEEPVCWNTTTGEFLRPGAVVFTRPRVFPSITDFDHVLDDLNQSANAVGASMIPQKEEINLGKQKAIPAI